MSISPFQPSFGLANPHINTILSSSHLRTYALRKSRSVLRASSQEHIMTTPQGVRLQSFYTPAQTESKGLCILIHGWEGSSDSNYIVGTATALLDSGFNVLRLNMRDHGDTHHLNKAPFLAINLEEIEQTIAQCLALYPQQNYYLVGFSLGGNVAARIAATSVAHNLQQVVAVCPPISPAHAVQVVAKQAIYNRYFAYKWKKSLSKKIQLFPEYTVHSDLLACNDLAELHRLFVPRFSDCADDQAYYARYTLDRNNLPNLYCNLQVVMADDDPVIPVEDVALLPAHKQLKLTRLQQGGHCAFLENWKMECWLDKQWEHWLSE